MKEFKALSETEARLLYRAICYEKPGLHKLPAGIRSQLFDMAIHHGPKAAIRFLQHALNALGCGPLAVETALKDGKKLNAALVSMRSVFYRHLVRLDPSQRKFLEGWLRRAEEFGKEKL